MMYYPSMGEPPMPTPKAQRKPRIAVRPKPTTVINLQEACQHIFRDTQPEEIARRNEERRHRRLARAPQPATQNKQVVMIAHEYSPLSDNPALRNRVSEILTDLTEIGSEEATRRILQAIIEPHRVRVIQMAQDYQHQLSEIEERYNA